MPLGGEQPRREAVAIGLGLITAPAAFGVVSALDGWLLTSALDGLGFELGEQDRVVLRLFTLDLQQAFGTSYVFSWLIVMPPIILLRARNCLSFWSAAATAVIIPAAGAATMALLTRWASRGTASALVLTYLYLTYLLVPGSVAVAVAFWRVYSFFTGRRFFEPPHWRQVVSLGDAR